ncbi:hypothetical protein FXV91_16875 [Methanosarcina sp. DH2]|nr:hypothetical protein [Methanosarcina sp. DH2]MCC4771778.1 hypothetical protein [Methanosarcina sp. DH2]
MLKISSVIEGKAISNFLHHLLQIYQGHHTDNGYRLNSYDDHNYDD